MTAAPAIYRDERTLALENTSYRWAYLCLSFGLLLVVAYRSFALGEQSWDLLALVVAGGLVGTAYQAFHRILSRPWVVTVIATLAIAVGIAALAAWLRN